MADFRSRGIFFVTSSNQDYVITVKIRLSVIPVCQPISNTHRNASLLHVFAWQRGNAGFILPHNCFNYFCDRGSRATFTEDVCVCLFVC